MTSQDQQPGCGRAGHEQACHASESQSLPWLAGLTFQAGVWLTREEECGIQVSEGEGRAAEGPRNVGSKECQVRSS